MLENKIITAEYIWIDGSEPVPTVRSKTKVVSKDIKEFPIWGFDGSSTNQAKGQNSDLILKPVCNILDPLSNNEGHLVLCEVYNPDGNTPHETNTRSKLRKTYSIDVGVWLGFEQEYVFYKDGRPLGWEEGKEPEPQGSYYCGVGHKKVVGREIVEEHLNACLKAGVLICGVNAEVMFGQWEYQIGYRGIEKEVDAVTVCDHLWLARWLMYKIAEKYGVEVSIENKPVKGNWNGSGMHTNFSTVEMRKGGGIEHILRACKKLEDSHQDCIKVYGYKLEERLSGKFETSDINSFSFDIADRGSSIRVPRPVSLEGCGYFEDRRPGANADPYQVAEILIKNVCV